MKKSLLIGIVLVVSIGMLAFKAIEQKKYTVSFTQDEWNSRYQWVAVARDMLEKSSLPINQVKPLNDSLNKFMMELSNQIIPQLPKDSTKKK